LGSNWTSRPQRWVRPRSIPVLRPDVRIMTVGPTEAGPGVTVRRSEPWERPKPRPWLRSPCLGACRIGTSQLPQGRIRRHSPEGEVGRGRLDDASPGAKPEGETTVLGPKRSSIPRRSEGRATARCRARERRVTSQGAVQAQPQRDGGPSSRARACHPVQQPGPRPKKCGAEALRPSIMGRANVGPERNETRCAPKCTLRNIAFYPILVSAV
jgi:hypothetical protein